MDSDRPKTLADLKVPSSDDGIDKRTLLEAWNLNVETQQDILTHLKRAESDNVITRADNKRTRRVVYGGLALLLASMAWFRQSADLVVQQTDLVVKLANVADTRLESVENTLKLVAKAVVSTNEANLAEESEPPLAAVLKRREAQKDAIEAQVKLAKKTEEREIMKKRLEMAQQRVISATVEAVLDDRPDSGL